MSVRIRGKRPSIPAYYMDLIDSSVDLTKQPKQCCPFHKESTPSFSYSEEKDIWRCFGACHCGGDVVDLHRMNYKLSSRAEAEKSLNAIYGIDNTKTTVVDADNYLDYVNINRVQENVEYLKVLQRANTVERWVELDYVMSKYPVESADIRSLLERWENEKYGKES